MPLYNIALCPDDPEFAAACVAAAQKQYAAVKHGYVLAPGTALPHVTLCQFESTGVDLEKLWESVRRVAVSHIKLVLNSTYMLLGNNENTGFVWAGIGVVRSRQLVESQKQVFNRLGEQGVASTNDLGEHFWPHLTFARMREADAVKCGAPWPKEMLSHEPRDFSLTLGLSDENGVYLKKIFPI